ncbi:hypothetical protein OUZ56_007678 [Daphnia magna]|uniref:Uncharacterized protein n=1 Tax=Daphnia magna TaxID=35525 RepID=A0ABR0AAT7_9CRUS|nr:hypothetical protein OUZ56_007678 [Daphnia magna]
MATATTFKLSNSPRDILYRDAPQAALGVGLRFLQRLWQATSNNDLRAVYAPAGRVLTHKTFTHGDG